MFLWYLCIMIYFSVIRGVVENLNFFVFRRVVIIILCLFFSWLFVCSIVCFWRLFVINVCCVLVNLSFYGSFVCFMLVYWLVLVFLLCLEIRIWFVWFLMILFVIILILVLDISFILMCVFGFVFCKKNMIMIFFIIFVIR